MHGQEKNIEIKGLQLTSNVTPSCGWGGISLLFCCNTGLVDLRAFLFAGVFFLFFYFFCFGISLFILLLLWFGWRGVFLFYCLASFYWVPQISEAGVRKETALLHWLLLSLPFLYWIDSYLKRITCLLCIGWIQWQWMEVTLVQDKLFFCLATGQSSV